MNELELNDWRGMESAPRNAQWIEVDTGTEIVRAHFAQDLSGEEQPAFSGWFRAVSGQRWSNEEQQFGPDVYFTQVTPKLKVYYCTSCGRVRAFHPDRVPHQDGRTCRECLNGQMQPLAINFDAHRFEGKE
jgi:hypothetical protein